MHWDKVADLWKEFKAKRQEILHLKREQASLRSRQPVDRERIAEIEREINKLDIRCSKIDVFIKSIR